MGSYVISVSAGTGCYRHIQISDKVTLYQLHEAIVDAFGFYCDEYTAHAFFMDNHFWSPDNAFFSDCFDDRYRSTEKYTLKKLKIAPGDKFKYIFDLHEEFRIQCKVLRELTEETLFPKLIRSVGEDPEQSYGSDAENDEDDIFSRNYPEEYSREILKSMYECLPVPPNTVELLRKYFDSATELYGIIPLKKLLEIYNLQNPPLSEEDFLAVSEVFRHEAHNYAILGQEAFYDDVPVSKPIDRKLVGQHLFFMDIEDYYVLEQQQRGKPYYIPKKEEFLLACTDLAYPETVQSRNMLSYLMKKRKILKCPPRDVLLEIQDFLNLDFELNIVAEDAARLGLELDSLHDAQTFIGLLADLNNHTRKLSNRGHTPAQLYQYKIGAPKLQSSPNSSPTFSFPFNNPTPIPVAPKEATPAKPSRNKPCPCGSGKKYKHCCGKDK